MSSGPWSTGNSGHARAVDTTHAERHWQPLWYGMVPYHTILWHEVCEGAPVAVGGWVLADRHDLAPRADNSLHRVAISVNDITHMVGRY